MINDLILCTESIQPLQDGLGSSMSSGSQFSGSIVPAANLTRAPTPPHPGLLLPALLKRDHAIRVLPRDQVSIHSQWRHMDFGSTEGHQDIHSPVQKRVGLRPVVSPCFPLLPQIVIEDSLEFSLASPRDES
jgi:hypothetical protein